MVIFFLLFLALSASEECQSTPTLCPSTSGITESNNLVRGFCDQTEHGVVGGNSSSGGHRLDVTDHQSGQSFSLTRSGAIGSGAADNSAIGATSDVVGMCDGGGGDTSLITSLADEAYARLSMSLEENVFKVSLDQKSHNNDDRETNCELF